MEETKSIYPLYEPFPAPRAGHSPKQYGFRLPGISSTDRCEITADRDSVESSENGTWGSLRRIYFQQQQKQQQQINGYQSTEASPVTPNVFIERGRNTTLWTVLRCIENFIGTGVFLLPGLFAKLGIPSLVLMAFISLIMGYTASLLERCQRAHSLESYPEVIFAALADHKSRFLVSTIVYCHILLNLAIYVTFMRICLQNVMREQYVIPVLCVSDIPVAILLSLLGMTMVYVRWTEFLFNLEAVLKFCLLLSTVVLMVVLFARYSGSSNFSTILYGSGRNGINISAYVECTAIYCFCFLGHKMLPTLYTGMARTSQFPNALNISIISVVVIYTIVSIIGGIVYYTEDTSDMQGFYLLRIRPLWLSSVFLLCFLSVLSSKFLNESSALTEGLVESFNLKERILIGRGRGYSLDAESLMINCQELALSIVMKIAFPVLSIFISNLSPDVYSLVALNGGVFGVCICWILPIISFQRLNVSASHTQSLEEMSLAFLLYTGVFLMVVTSFWFMLTNTSTTTSSY